jgi:hypothetical protein
MVCAQELLKNENIRDATDQSVYIFQKKKLMIPLKNSQVLSDQTHPALAAILIAMLERRGGIYEAVLYINIALFIFLSNILIFGC